VGVRVVAGVVVVLCLLHGVDCPILTWLQVDWLHSTQGIPISPLA